MLIGISGKAGSGKDLSADYLIQILDKGVQTSVKKVIQVKHFGDKVKDVVSVITGCPRFSLDDQEFKKLTLPEEWNRTVEHAREWIIMKLFERKFQAPATSTVPEEIIKQAKEMGFKFERTYRELLQEVGTDLFRESLSQDTWITALFSEYKPIVTGFRGWGRDRGSVESHEEFPRWIIADVRFPNEAAAIKKRGGVLLRINRYPKTLYRNGDPLTGEEINFDPSNPAHMDLYISKSLRGHASETALDKYQGFDAVIDNNGTKDELYAKLEETVNNLKLK